MFIFYASILLFLTTPKFHKITKRHRNPVPCLPQADDRFCASTCHYSLRAVGRRWGVEWQYLPQLPARRAAQTTT